MTRRRPRRHHIFTSDGVGAARARTMGKGGGWLGAFMGWVFTDPSEAARSRTRVKRSTAGRRRRRTVRRR
jgi:hypothetical protein